jgi:hypothetical protein
VTTASHPVPPPVVAHKSTSAEIGILRKVFQQCDKKGVGHLNYEEFKAAITAAGFAEEDYQKIFDAIVRWSVELCFALPRISKLIP